MKRQFIVNKERAIRKKQARKILNQIGKGEFIH